MRHFQKIIFFGTSFFAKEILLDLVEKKYSIVGVVTQKEEKKNFRHHPSEVKLSLEKIDKKIPLFEPESCQDPDFLQALKNVNPDLMIVVAYGKILPKILLAIPKCDTINIHASLLPKYRGAAPIQRAIMAGEKETGITIMKVIPALDSGEIIRQAKIDIQKEDIFDTVEKKLIDCAKTILGQVLQDFEKGQVKYTPQNDNEATYAEKIQKEECQIDWGKEAFFIHNQIRALAHKPGAWSFLKIKDEKKRIKIFRSQITPFQGEVGKTILSENKLIVACKDFSLELFEVQLEGKKIMNGKEFLLGIHDFLVFL